MDLPINSMVIFHSYVKLPEGKVGYGIGYGMFMGFINNSEDPWSLKVLSLEPPFMAFHGDQQRYVPTCQIEGKKARTTGTTGAVECHGVVVSLVPCCLQVWKPFPWNYLPNKAGNPKIAWKRGITWERIKVSERRLRNHLMILWDSRLFWLFPEWS